MMDKKILGVPIYGILALTVMLIINFSTYIGNRMITKDMAHHDFSLPIDGMIPFVKSFIIIYVIIAYVQWIGGYYLIGRQEKRLCFFIVTAEIIAKLITLICFLTLPAEIKRPEIVDTDFLSRFVKWVYDTDPPSNLFPSIHCLESLIIARTAYKLKDVPKWYPPVTIVTSVLVCASTLLVKQHFFVDVIGAIVVVEVGLFVSGKLPFSKIEKS
ncbi:MAG: phosphatase PAP2 family protein [Lachnospiraceae bacterium]|nr:phosphatase PAP2 family protein [Lachnospiraceae bacterium]